MKKRKILAILLVIIMMVSLVGCGESKSGNKKENTKSEKIILGINDWPGSYWWLAVDELGYFKEAGVEVEVQLFSNYADGLNALNSGNIDMFVPALADIIPAYVSGANIKVIMVQDFSAGADGLIAEKGIQSVEEVKGKNVAIE